LRAPWRNPGGRTLHELRGDIALAGLYDHHEGAIPFGMHAEITTTEARSRRLGRLTRVLRATFGLAVDVALPQLCPACREPVDGEGLCARCWSKLSFIAPPYCERLGIPFPYDPGPGILSMEAIADPPAYNRARAAVRYDDISRVLIHALKYGDRLDLAPTMGRWMVHAGRELLASADAIIPVPLHWRRQWARRFNQSALLCEVISKACLVPVAHTALKRVKPTPQQVGLSQSERALNVQGAFRVLPSAKVKVEGQRLVLVDDVLTSGATVDACARALLRAGAAQVDVLVFARVVAAVRPPI
jgi:ComF family protein